MMTLAMALARAMSEPTSIPSHTSAHLRRLAPSRIDAIQAGPVVDPLQQVMEEDRMGGARVRTPEQDHIGVLDLLV